MLPVACLWSIVSFFKLKTNVSRYVSNLKITLCCAKTMEIWKNNPYQQNKLQKIITINYAMRNFRQANDRFFHICQCLMPKNKFSRDESHLLCKNKMFPNKNLTTYCL
jgi:hypothetical protein